MMPFRPRAASLARALAVVALAVAWFGHVFALREDAWRTTGLGDWIDPYFINALLEQWWYSARHLTDPASPPVFFPALHTVGYSCSLMLYAPFYFLVRPWTHPFMACTLTLWLVMVTGTVCLYAILRTYVRLTFVESLLVTAVFATSMNVVNGYSATWSQSASVFLVPPILLLGLWAARRSPRSRIGVWLLGLTGFLSLSMFTQDFYSGVMTFLLVALTLVGTQRILGWPLGPDRLRVLPPAPRRPLHVVRRLASWLALGVAGIGFAWMRVAATGQVFGIPVETHHHHGERPAFLAIGALAVFFALRGGVITRVRLRWRPVPAGVRAFAIGAALAIGFFLWCYLPSYIEHVGFSDSELTNSILPRDFTYWRHPIDFARNMVAFDSARSFTLVLVMAAMLWLPWLRIDRRLRLGALWLFGMSAFVALLSIRFGDLSLWRAFFAPLPGLGAIRDPKRIIFPYELAAALGLGVLIANLPRRSALRIGGALLIAASLVYETNPNTFPYRRPVDIFARYVEAPVAIDPSCRSFFVTHASNTYAARSDNMWALYSLDAEFIAMRLGIPTLNGYSAWSPHGWEMVDAHTPWYPDNVAKWVRRSGLQHVCALDLETRAMTPYVLPPEAPMPGR